MYFSFIAIDLTRATNHPSRKLSKLEEPDMQDTAED